MFELWSTNHDAYSHRCRIVIHEKNVSFERKAGVKVRIMEPGAKMTDDLARINPSNRIPMLVDHGNVLYEPNIINEYLDERFPHPQLMPLSVAEKGKARLMLHDLDKDLYARLDQIMLTKPSKKLDTLRAELSHLLLLFSQNYMDKAKFVIGNDFGMLDIALAPLLWRLDFVGVKLAPRAAPLLKYAETVFGRASFIKSLTPAEKEMRR